MSRSMDSVHIRSSNMLEGQVAVEQRCHSSDRGGLRYVDTPAVVAPGLEVGEESLVAVLLRARGGSSRDLRRRLVRVAHRTRHCELRRVVYSRHTQRKRPDEQVSFNLINFQVENLHECGQGSSRRR